MAKDEEFIPEKTNKEKSEENKQLDKQLKNTMEDKDVDAEVLIPSSEYIDLVAKSKYKHAPMTKKRKVLTIVGACLGAVGIAGGVTAGILFGLRPQAPVTTDVVFDLNGGQIISGEQNNNFEVNKTLGECTVPTVAREGHVFLGWKDKNGAYYYDLRGMKVNDWADTVKDKGRIFIAQWYEIKDYIKINFNATQQGGRIISGSDYTYIFKDTCWKDINKPTVEKDNAVFECWKDKNGKIIQENDKISTDEQEFFAHFSDSYDYILNFHADESKGEHIYGNTKIAARKEQLFGELNHPNIYKENCILAGWYYIKNEQKIILEDYDVIEENLDLYPEWYETSIIHYNTNGGVIESGSEYQYVFKNVHFLSDITRPVITRENYVIDYWEKYDETIKGWVKLTEENDLIQNNNWIVRPVWKIGLETIYVDAPEYVDVTKESTDINVLFAPITFSQETKCEIINWLPDIAGVEQPVLKKKTKNTFTINGQNTGTVTLKFSSAVFPTETSLQKTIDIRIKYPYERSDSYFTFVEGTGWGEVENICSQTEKINVKWFNGNEESFERNQFNKQIWIGDQLGVIEDNFLYNCSEFKCNLFNIEKTNIKSIGKNFMYGCEKFNQKIVLPVTLLTVKQNFMNNCKLFNNTGAEFVIPNTVEMVGSGFMYNCYKMTSSINISAETEWISSRYTLSVNDNSCEAYSSGINITGTGESNFKNIFTESSVDPFRRYKA